MQICKTIEELSAVADNTVIGAENLTLQGSDIRFGGTGNVLFVEGRVKLVGSNLKFLGSDCLIYLCENAHETRLDISVYRNSAVFIGRENYFNGALHIIASEGKHVFLGDDGLFAYDIFLRTADPHLVFSAKTKKRVNPSRSVFIGDHVWVGQSVMLLKGTQLASGCIVGAGAVCPGKKVPSNASAAGNPLRVIAEDIFWDSSCVHGYTEKETAAHAEMNTDKYIFRFDKSEAVPFETIDKALTEAATPQKQLAYLQQLNQTKTKNRFAIGEEAPKGKHGLFRK